MIISLTKHKHLSELILLTHCKVALTIITHLSTLLRAKPIMSLAALCLRAS
jgi:hypothetical protein